MENYKAVIWDCDGVLIDSEILACSCAAEWFSERGYSITTDDFIGRFMGKGSLQILREILAETGQDHTLEFQSAESFKKKQRELFEQSLQATKGISDVLQEITLPMAVASGSELDRLNFTLGLTGLLPRFNGHIYSAEMVERGKPAPDIFLYAAKALGVAPQDCLVVEDGIHGIHAAKSAGMDVVAYTGASHMTSHLKEKVLATNPMTFIENMDALLPIVYGARRA